MHILLVAPQRQIPGFASSHFHSVINAAVAPVDLATVAALTPPEFDVDIWDEAIDGRIGPGTRFAQTYDLVGVGGYTTDLLRAIEIGEIFRERNIPVVAGGVGVTSEPHRYRDYFDVLFVGEAEYTWPKFLSDFKSGNYQNLYRQVSRVEMTDSPPPRWGAISRNVDRYARTVVQTTRGCPFDCEFCDVISLFGRQPRHKTIEQVIEEVRTLSRLGAVGVLLADDNFYGHPTYSKALLRELALANRSFERPLYFWTQITLNVAKDHEMLQLLIDANVSDVLIGIESPNKESLIETNKPQNYKVDILDALKTVQSYGIRVHVSLIVGFDHDDAGIFQQQFEFIQQACAWPVSIWTLYAMPGTKLWARLQKERRVLEEPRLKKVSGLSARMLTNVVPVSMELEDLYLGYRTLLNQANDWPNFERRMEGLIERTERYPELMLRVRKVSWRQATRLLRSIIFTKAGREGIVRLFADKQAQEVKRRLKQRVPGNSGRERFLRLLIDSAVLKQHHTVRYMLPELFETLDGAVNRLRAEGLPARERATFGVPDPFRKPYEAIFPVVYQHVHNGLLDKSRVEIALVEIFCDFLARWGSTFQGLEDYHRQQLIDISDRTIEKQNNIAQDNTGGVPHNTGETTMLTGLKLRRLGTEVLRCVEEDSRKYGDQPADLAHAATR